MTNTIELEQVQRMAGAGAQLLDVQPRLSCGPECLSLPAIGGVVRVRRVPRRAPSRRCLESP
jgi:hypothetical protein